MEKVEPPLKAKLFPMSTNPLPALDKLTAPPLIPPPTKLADPFNVPLTEPKAAVAVVPLPSSKCQAATRSAREELLSMQHSENETTKIVRIVTDMEALSSTRQ